MKSILKDIFTFILIAALLVGFSACVTYAKQDYTDHYLVNMTA